MHLQRYYYFKLVKEHNIQSQEKISIERIIYFGSRPKRQESNISENLALTAVLEAAQTNQSRALFV